VTDPLLERLGDLATVAGAWSVTSESAEARQILAPLLRTGRLSRFRLLDVACPNDDRLAQVVRTAKGPLVLGKTRAVRGYSVTDDDAEPAARVVVNAVERLHRQQHVIYLLDRLPPQAGIELQCRCRVRTVPVVWLREQITAHRSRAQWTE
jgi:hypothetical protein